MIKVSTFLSETEFGLSAVPLFGPADSVFEKTASAGLLPEVQTYIAGLRPRKDAQYVLVNALGAGEFFGSNINGDHFPEAALIHRPAQWTGNPLVDKAKAADWAYGFPTFYGAHPYAHHKNKDSSRAYGEVELTAWNDKMKRVELVVRVDYEKCVRFAGMGIWDKLQDGQFPDVSMGSKVPYDTCSITLDLKTYNEALSTFDPKRHKHPGIAVLEFHKKLKAKHGKGIRGLAVTRDEYSDYCLNKMNQILPDGRKVFVYNDFPRFFDISFVFIGADRTAKVMIFISRSGAAGVPSAFVAEQMGMSDEPGLKVASVDEALLEHAFKGAAQRKEGEIDKKVESNLPPNKAVPLMTRNEEDIPRELMNLLCASPIDKALSTTASLGIVLRPREFQRLVLVKMGKAQLADELEKKAAVFTPSEDTIDAGMSAEKFSHALARSLTPLLEKRSAFSPFIEHRAMMSMTPAPLDKSASSLSEDALRKMGAAYNGYRRGVMELVSSAQDLIESVAGSNNDLSKLASASAEQVFTPLSFHYLSQAFLDEMPNQASVQRGLPSRTTST